MPEEMPKAVPKVVPRAIFPQLLQNLVSFIGVHKHKFEDTDTKKFMASLEELLVQSKFDCFSSFFLGLRMGQGVKIEDTDAIVAACKEILDGEISHAYTQGDLFDELTKKDESAAPRIKQNCQNIEQLIAQMIVQLTSKPPEKLEEDS